MAQLRLARGVLLSPDSPRPHAGRSAGRPSRPGTAFLFDGVLIEVVGQMLFMNDAVRQMTGRITRTIRDWLARMAGLFCNEAIPSLKSLGQHAGHYSALPSPAEGAALPSTVLVAVVRLSATEAWRTATAVQLYSLHDAKDLWVRLVGVTPSRTSVAQLLCQWRKIPEITRDLTISRPTVNDHPHNIFCKSATTRQSELAPLLQCAQSNE